MARSVRKGRKGGDVLTSKLIAQAASSIQEKRAGAEGEYAMPSDKPIK